ncbi:hypothetical protein ALC62_00166 [Cyphomyrmex costatus]|uniref:Peptidase A2 domain-containing protein n=1 Tax=Cyphomyrmex costatus TaxID=456900 RepID=A0A151K2T0_9HYME|nr:hypothetical protein ALC62_00166 [Cyphomyrmex costatus]
MIDTGASPNVLKHRNLNPEIRINRDDTLFLIGITNGKIDTLGSVELLISGHPVKFYIVPDDFPILQEGLLESAFLRGVSTISLENNLLEWRGNRFSFVTSESLTIPARSRIVSYLRVKNTHLRYGYVPPLSVRGHTHRKCGSF